MKINDYPEITDLSQGDKLIVETPDGTKKIDGSNIVKDSDNVITLDPVILHRNTYRGKNLGTTFTDEQKEAIANGTFDDLYVGDYWNINGYTWRIADIDFFIDSLKPSDYEKITNHHLVMIPDFGLYKTKMLNDSTIPGYVNGVFNTSTKNQAINLIKSSFGENSMMNFIAQVSSGSKHYHAFIVTNIVIPQSSWIFGNYFSDSRYTDEMYNNVGDNAYNETKMKIFDFNCNYAYNVTNESTDDILQMYWLSDQAQSGNKYGFGYVTNEKRKWWNYGDEEYWVRPIFCLKGE